MLVVKRYNTGLDESIIDHDLLLNYVANQHVNWINTASNLLTTGSGTFGTLVSNGIVQINTANELRFYNAADTFYVGFEAPALAANQIWILPTADGGVNEVLTTNGAGTLSWSAGGGGGSPGGADTQIQYNNSGAFGGSANFIWNNASNFVSLTGHFNINDGTDSVYFSSRNTAPGTGRNVVIGSGSMYYNNSNFCIALGYNASRGVFGVTNNADYNVSIGYGSLYSITLGDFNCCIGYNSGYSISSGSGNCYIGSASGNNCTTSGDNVGIGTNALYGAAPGTFSRNVGIGDNAMHGATSASYNVGVGDRSLYGITSGGWNSCVGYYSGYSISSGSGNCYIGSFSGRNCTTSGDNVGIGTNSLYGAAPGTFSRNVSIGNSAMYSATTSSYNVGIGDRSLYLATTGGYNVCIGYNSGYSITTGGGNCYIGALSGRNCTTSGDNVGIGGNALYGAAPGTFSRNVGIGYGSLYSVTTATNNTIVGYRAGYSLVVGTNNIFIGYQAGYNEVGSQKLYIADSNTATPLIYGDFASLYVKIHGDLHIQDNNNIVLDTTNGTQIATAANQLLGFFGVTPVVQQAHIIDADGTLADITTKFNTLLAQLEALGLIANA